MEDGNLTKAEINDAVHVDSKRERSLIMSETFWYKIRLQQGFDIEKPMTFEERLYWHKVRRCRAACEEASNPYDAIQRTYPFDKQYFLGK